MMFFRLPSRTNWGRGGAGSEKARMASGTLFCQKISLVKLFPITFLLAVRNVNKSLMQRWKSDKNYTENAILCLDGICIFVISLKVV